MWLALAALASLLSACSNAPPDCEALAPPIVPAEAPSGVVGVGYEATFSVAGTGEPLTWTVLGGELPPGLSLDGARGLLSGTPVAEGEWSFVLAAEPAAVSEPACAVQPAQGSYTISIGPEEIPRGRCGPAFFTGWANARDLPGPRESASVVLHQGRLYVLGGFTGRAATDGVHHAAVSEDGSVGEFIDDSPLPAPVERAVPIVHDGSLFLIGGDDGEVAVADIVLGQLTADGGIGALGTVAPLPEPRVGHAAVAIGDRVYLLGGATAVGGPATTDVLSGRLAADGIEDFRDETPLPVASLLGAATVHDGRIYLVTSADGRTAVLRGDGAGGTLAWTMLQDVPGGQSAVEVAAVGDHLVAAGGYLGAASAPTTYTAALDAEGGLDAWAPLGNLPSMRFGHRMVASRTHLFAVGGWAVFGSPPSRTVLVAGLCE